MPQSADSIIINKDVLGMSELRPRPVLVEGYASPGGASVSHLIDSPRPGSKPPISTSEIMPLLKAHFKREERKNFKDMMTNVLKVPALTLLLYVFICSLDFLSTSFRLMAGKAAGQ